MTVMTLSEMLEAHMRRVRRLEKTHSTSGKIVTGLEENLVKNCEIRSSASSALTLVPMDRPFREGARYLEAGAIELRTRLDLYHEADGAPWQRIHGLLTWQPKD